MILSDALLEPNRFGYRMQYACVAESPHVAKRLHGQPCRIIGPAPHVNPFTTRRVEAEVVRWFGNYPVTHLVYSAPSNRLWEVLTPLGTFFLPAECLDG